MELRLLPMAQTDMKKFKHDIQEAFQKGFEAVYGETKDIILPEKDIDRSLNAVGNPAPNDNEEFIGDGGDGMFVFQKHMRTV